MQPFPPTIIRDLLFCKDYERFYDFFTRTYAISSHYLDPHCGSGSEMGAVALVLAMKILAVDLAHFLPIIVLN